MAEEITPEDLVIPRALRQTLQVMIEELEIALSDELESVLVYGSAARGDWRENVSDVNVMLVTKSVNVRICQLVQEPLQRAQRKWPIALELFTATDIERSADVFPLKFLDIQRNHHVLHGDDPIRGVNIAWDHLRLRVEQQIKSLLFEMRRSCIDDAARPERQLEELRRGFSTFLLCLGALLFLRGGQWWLSEKEPIIAEAVNTLGMDASFMETLLEVNRRIKTPDREQLARLLDRFLLLVTRVATIVDELEEQPGGSE